MNLAAAARVFAGMAIAHHEGKHKAMEKACKIVEDEAKRVIGTFDYGWPDLKESTQSQRESLGYEPDEPLLRTGEHIRDTIQHNVVVHPFGAAHGYVGSDSDIAVYQERGTSRIPPRSFLVGAAHAKEKQVVDELADELIGRVLLKNVP
jgi:hypothetical protein